MTHTYKKILAVFALAAAGAAAASPVPAVTSGPGSVNMVSDGLGGVSAGISNTIQLAGDFTDTYTLNGLSGLASVTANLMTGGRNSFGIDFFSVTINGLDFSLTQVAGAGIPDFSEFASFDNTELGAPFVLVVKGHAGDSLSDGTPINATYSGSVNMSSNVPEPASLALAGVALLAAGFAKRRRPLTIANAAVEQDRT